MTFKITNKRNNTTDTVECRYPIIASFIIVAVLLIIAIVGFITGLKDINALNVESYAGKSSYTSGGLIVMCLACIFMFDLLFQIITVFYSLQRNAYANLLLIGSILMVALFYILFFTQGQKGALGLVYYAPIFFGLSYVVGLLKVGSFTLRSEKLYYERTVLFVILNLLFDIVIALVLFIISLYIVFLIAYIILCIIFRSEPTCVIIVLIVK